MQRLEIDRTIDAFAERQHGVVTRAQLLSAGVSAAAVDRRVKRVQLRLVHRGVYRVGPVTTPGTRDMAAVLACGQGAALAGTSAAALLRLPPQQTGGLPVEVVVPGRRTGAMAGIRAHHVRELPESEVTVHDGIPVTTVERTLLDLAATWSERDLERAVAEAIVLRLASPAVLEAMAHRAAGRPGVARLRKLITPGTPMGYTRSEAEVRFLALVRRTGLREPETNARVAGIEVDFVWRAERLGVEVDGEAFHAPAARFEADRRRDAILLAAGFRIMRVTWRQLVAEPKVLLVRLAQALVR